MFLPRPASRRRLFQSTLPRGERPGCQIHGFYNILISIHAPARGATRSGSASGERLRNFNPRSREGSDDKEAKEFYNSAISIHAPARGATNPWKGVGELQNISIHAPARGATSSETRSPFRRQISIHAPARGATRCWLSVLHSHPISIHAPARGATSILSKIHPMFLTISHNASSFSSFPFHSFLPHLLNSSTFCALFQVRISRAFSVYYRFAPKKSTPDL